MVKFSKLLPNRFLFLILTYSVAKLDNSTLSHIKAKNKLESCYSSFFCEKSKAVSFTSSIINNIVACLVKFSVKSIFCIPLDQH